MAVKTVNALRVWVSGAEHNDFGANAPTDGNITISTVQKRTGTYAYRVNALSATKSTWALNSSDTKTNFFSAFFRGYLYIATLPSVTRAILCRGATTLGATVPGLRLRSTGILEFHDGASVLAAGSTALATGTWYRIEIGMNSTDDQLSLRIDGEIEIDWTTVGNMAALGTIHIGAIDTAASAFDLYWDDLAIDGRDWCGPGRVKRLAVTGPGSLTEAGFTIGGSSPAATKWQSINEVGTDDGVTFVSTSATNGHQETYALENIPGDCEQIRGIMIRLRHRRNGGTNGSINIITYLYGHLHVGVVTGSTSAWQWIETTMEVGAFRTPVGGQWTNDRINALEIGAKTNSTNPSDYSSLAAEIDYDDTAGSIVTIYRRFATGFEAGDLTAEGIVVGTAAAATNVARTATYSERVNPAGSTASYVRCAIDTNEKEFYLSGWIYVTARPAVGSTMRLFSFGFSTLHNAGVRMDSDGKIQLDDKDGLVGSLSTLAIPLTTWTRIDFMMRGSTTTTSDDGIAEVLVDGTSYCTSTTMSGNSAQSNQMNIGTTLAPGASGCDVNYDDVVVDCAYWVDPVDDIKVIDILPTAAGALTGTGFSVTGAATQWEALDETPSNGDTDYVGTGTTNPATGSYVAQNVPAEAGEIRSVTAVGSFKRDGASNGIAEPAVRTNGHTDGAVSTATTSAYAWQRLHKMNTDYDGAWTPALVDATELVIKNQSAANASRCSNLRATVEYVYELPVTGLAYSQIIVAA